VEPILKVIPSLAVKWAPNGGYLGDGLTMIDLRVNSTKFEALK